jgi:hypothetical protein
MSDIGIQTKEDVTQTLQELAFSTGYANCFLSKPQTSSDV